MKHKLWLVAIALIGAGLALPYFSAGFVRQQLQASLEAALSRQVRIQGETRLRVFPRPSIVADDVIISEDKSFSLEPFAYVTELEVQPSFLALLGGRIEVTRLRLTEPSVNLMRSDRGWNIQSLVSGKLRPPEVEVRNGRLNFKQGNSKSPFYFANALVDLSAPTEQGDVKVFISAEPARTDRGPQGFGVVAVRGSVHIPRAAAPALDFDVELQPSSLHAFNFFFGARGVDFAGKLAARGRLMGPWHNAKLDAALQFEGLEPKGFLPFTGRSNALKLSGLLDIPGQRFALDTVGGDQLRIRMRAHDFFQSPRGAMLIDLRNVELAKLQQFGREAGAKLPEGLAVDGKFNGVIGYNWPSVESVPAKGMIWFESARVELPEQPRLQIPAARAIVEGSRWILAPAEIQVGESQTAVVRTDWNARTGALELDVATQLLSVRGLATGLGLLLRASELPLLARASGGSWQGNLKYTRSDELDHGAWSGRLTVRNSAITLPGTADELAVSTALVQFDPNRVQIRRMRAEWSTVEVEGDVSYYPATPRATEVNLTISQANISHLVRLFAAAQRPPAGLLEKMRLRRASMPEWLRERNVRGRVLVKSLAFASGAFEPLSCRFEWISDKFTASIDSAVYVATNGSGEVRALGKFSTELWQPSVQYRWEGTLTGWPVDKGAPLNIEGKFSTSSLEAHWDDLLEGEGMVSGGENGKLIVQQGRLAVESADARRRAIAPPYWPLALPAEP
jgi:hypothetical protein